MYRSALIAAFALFLVSCSDNGVVTPPGERQWQADIVGIGAFVGLTGQSTVVFTEGTTQFTASAEIAGDEVGAVRPWHVHFGTCGTGGAIVGGDGAYPRLEVGADGTATASATVPQPLQVGADYHVNVHLSVPEMATIIACGNLVLTD